MLLRMGGPMLSSRRMCATGLEFDPALSTQASPGLLLAQAPDTARACAGEGSVSVDPSDTDSADASLDNLANANSASHVAAVLRGEALRMLEVYAGHQLLPAHFIDSLLQDPLLRDFLAPLGQRLYSFNPPRA